MDLGIRGRAALVCGASSGLGRACAQRLAEEGARVAVVSRDPERISRAAAEIAAHTGSELHAIAADLGVADGVELAVEQATQALGGIDILVHNTGGPPPGGPFDTSDQQWHDALELLVLSYLRLTRAVAPGMAARAWGRVVSITSYVIKEPSNELTLSSSLRPAIAAIAKAQSRQFGRQNVLFNVVMPGAFLTDRQTELLGRRAQASGRTLDEVREAAFEAIPVGHMGDPNRLGDLVAFLVSDLNQDITGAAIPIEGGSLRGLF